MQPLKAGYSKKKAPKAAAAAAALPAHFSYRVSKDSIISEELEELTPKKPMHSARTDDTAYSYHFVVGKKRSLSNERGAEISRRTQVTQTKPSLEISESRS